MGFGMLVAIYLSLGLVRFVRICSVSLMTLWDTSVRTNFTLSSVTHITGPTCDVIWKNIPSCKDCQQNKSCTMKAAGLLHPLPVPDSCGSSVAMDFVGPLKPDQGFDCILTITDRLGADIQIIPTQTNISTKELAVLFFNHWFCENGLLHEIISDQDKLFVSVLDSIDYSMRSET
jgi:hypothetical protein